MSPAPTGRRFHLARTFTARRVEMDWTTLLGWGSPIGLGVLLAGIGLIWRGWASLRAAYGRTKASGS